jgi:hypothetical protein
MAEQRWTEQNTREHFTQNFRLVNPEQQSHRLGRHRNHRHMEELSLSSGIDALDPANAPPGATAFPVRDA